ncbi:MAG: class I SAM-dependent methyltransferase [Proteobacteria bacterium]|nr:class I SAM-dependent methyltransferase [Pseudomonadota bacterium]
MKKSKKISAKEAYELGAGPQFDIEEVRLGPWTSYSMVHDPKHLVFVLSRYKFCAKMLEGKARAMEVGCGDGFGISIVAQAVGHLHCVDWEPRHIESNPKRLAHLTNVTYELADVTQKRPSVKIDAAFSIDVIEHLEPESEKAFMDNIVRCLVPSGVLITGTPNISAAQYATERSRIQHINLKSFKTLREVTERYFENVFMFGMNDEVLHTSYAPMCHYIWAIGVGLRPEYR